MMRLRGKDCWRFGSEKGQGCIRSDCALAVILEKEISARVKRESSMYLLYMRALILQDFLASAPPSHHICLPDMSLLRPFSALDLFRFNNINLDAWTETVSKAERPSLKSPCQY